ncbi:hypothetical protein ES708_29428 [subsurface metagenome]
MNEHILFPGREDLDDGFLKTIISVKRYGWFLTRQAN